MVSRVGGNFSGLSRQSPVASRQSLDDTCPLALFWYLLNGLSEISWVSWETIGGSRSGNERMTSRWGCTGLQFPFLITSATD